MSVAAWTAGGGGADGLGDAGVHPVGDRRRAVLVLAGERVGLDERGCGERGQQGGGVGRVAGLAEAPPQVGPVGVDDPGLPVVFFEAGQELGHQPGRGGEPGQGGGGPGGEGVQELGGVQGGGAVAEERVQDLAACRGLGGVELGGEPGRVGGGGGVGEFHQLGVALHHVQHPADQVPVGRHRRLTGSRTGPASACSRARRPGSSRASATDSARSRACTGSASTLSAEPGGRDAAGQDHPGLPAMAGQRGHQRLPPRVPPGPGRGEQGFQVVQHQQDPAVFQQPPQPRDEPRPATRSW